MEFFMLNIQIALNQALSTIKHSISYSIYSESHIKFHNNLSKTKKTGVKRYYL